ncbi:MAG: membrane dipeptidase [Pseudomonadales bacterium]
MKIAFAALVPLTLAACVQTGAPRPDAQPMDAPPQADRIAQRHLIVDTHIDVPYRLYRDNDVDVSRATDGGDFDYPRARAGGLDALFMSIYIPAAVDEAGDATSFAEDLIDGVRNLAEDNPEKFAIATCTTDVLAAKAEGLIAMPLGMENGGPIAGDIDSLDHFRERGIRYITLAHSKSNHISDSSYDDDERWGGLSPFGKRLVPAMNQRGVMVDVSHITDAAFWQVLEISKVPVIASHSSLRHFTPGFQRNMSDRMVSALGRNGGVIQINFGSGFLTREARDYAGAMNAAREALLAEPGIADDDPRLVDFSDDYREANPYPYADIDDVLDHIDRAVRLAGIDHVGIGSDYDGVGDSLPTGLKDVSAYPNLVAGLLRRGYDDEEIAKILGGNLLRVWREVETYAAESGYGPLCSR